MFRVVEEAYGSMEAREWILPSLLVVFPSPLHGAADGEDDGSADDGRFHFLDWRL